MEVYTDDMVLFWKGDSIYSNFYSPCRIMYNGIEFLNSEALFMYKKCKFFGQEELAKKVLRNQVPFRVKAVGREIPNYDEEKWSKVRENMMLVTLYSKFGQRPDLKTALLETGDRELVEASPFDDVWGIGLGPDNPDALDKTKWKGQNLLGKTLMRLRDHFRSPNEGETFSID